MSQTERILYLDRMMRANGRVTVAQAASAFEVCTRQIKRDIQYMRDRFEAPIEYSRAIGGYHYERTFKDLEFADQHMIIFSVMVKSLLGNQQYIPVESQELFGSIEESIPKNYRDLCNNISYQMPTVSLIKPDMFLLIVNALNDKKCLEIVYRDRKNVESQRYIEPERVINYNGNWYIICFDWKTEDIRTFHLARIEKISLTDEKFRPHTKGYPNMEFKSYQDQIKAYISGGFGIFMGKKTKNVTIAFYDEAKRIVESQQWHTRQKIVPGEGEEPTLLTFPVADYTEICGKVLSFGSLAKPVSPPDFVDYCRDELKKMAALYQTAIL